ncbi:MAG: efflux RND transporter periplasmic adaptor subunit [Acidobacteria bacterium]|nr:efflux RND transporter periplasmic adaptor subunit [Acidobacteriota bacterium]
MGDRTARGRAAAPSRGGGDGRPEAERQCSDRRRRRLCANRNGGRSRLQPRAVAGGAGRSGARAARGGAPRTARPDRTGSARGPDRGEPLFRACGRVPGHIGRAGGGAGVDRAGSVRRRGVWCAGVARCASRHAGRGSARAGVARRRAAGDDRAGPGGGGDTEPMKMTRIAAGIVALALAGACSAPGAAPADLPDADSEERPAVVETRWTDRTELFVEYPVLVAGETSRFAIHLTDLVTFEPVRTGRAAVVLSGAGDEMFTADAPGRPGIFGVDVTPPVAGTYDLEIRLDAPGLADRHRLGSVTVHGSLDAAAGASAAAGDDAGTIPFLKEQQWTLDFATASAEVRPVADSLAIAAEIAPRTGGRADVTMPVAGRLAEELPLLPIGSFVARGDTLAEVIPHSGHGEDRPALELDVAEARSVLELSRATHARVDRLVEAGAVPERRQFEARVAEETAEARLHAAEAHLAQLDATRTGQGNGASDVRFVLRAPIAGVVAFSDATPGASVEAATRLFQVVAVDRVHVVGSVPEAALPRIADLAGAEVDVPGLGAPVPLDRLVAVGRVLDPVARTVPITYELRDPDPRIAIGQAVELRLFLSAATETVTVPESAVVDDAGQPVIFVQVGGESFERRPVTLGNREGGAVQVAGDVAPGERIVVRGAPLIRLAALSPQVPAHGHTH